MTAFSPLLTTILEAAEKAASSLMAHYSNRDALVIDHKGAGDFVSQADKKAEEVLLAFLMEKFPDWGFLGEEGTDIIGKDSRYRWIIDPLDGTTNFLHGIPHWAVSIGLEFNGEIIAGVIHDPVKNEIFCAEKNGGAFLNGKKITVSKRSELPNAMVATGIMGTRTTFQKQAQAESAKIHAVCADTRRMGSAALELSYIACGRLDAYIERGIKPWDIAAGMIIVAEAGGIVTDISNGNTMFTTQELLAGNPSIHRELVNLLASSNAQAA